MKSNKRIIRHWINPILLLAFGILLITAFSLSHARESVCAQVKIEILQEASLERQGFDAVMIIENGLENISLDNIDIQINFSDENNNQVIASSDPNSQDALFFIKLDRIDGLTDIHGNGKILPGTTAEIHWLIIPAPGTSGNLPAGKQYHVGATINYAIDSDTQTIEVIPDIIFVKPLPLISMDYFLTKDVYADDPFTNEIEPSEPFTLGVRIRNNGQAEARNFKIDSAQPKIIENEQGLLINFSLIASTVDGQDKQPDLLLEFGDIAGNSSRVGRWWMITSLAGQFVDFTASWSHADDLGGQLTSVIQSVNTHRLIHDVRVDLNGRDLVDDFLALDGAQLRVYESDSIDTKVTDFSSQASLNYSHISNSKHYYQLDIPKTGSYAYAKLADPFSGTKAIQQVIRSDHKVLHPSNAWVSREGNGADGWHYYINLFDVDSAGTYSIIFGKKINTNRAPVINFIPLQQTTTAKRLSFSITASDPDNTIPQLSASDLPSGAVFTDQGNGTGMFTWVPAVNQSGSHKINFLASDGEKKFSRSVTIDVQLVSVVDSDGDGMSDAWEMKHFGTLDRDGTGDFDHDGINDRDEYLNDSDPSDFYTTGLLEIYLPSPGSSIDQKNTQLRIINAAHPGNVSLSYQFQLFEDEALTQMVEQSSLIPETNQSGNKQTSWQPSQTLKDNHWYTWRARAYNGVHYSQWVTGYFFVNTGNDIPTIPGILTPPDGAKVSSSAPILEVSPASDNDGDILSYHFILYADSNKSIEIDRLNNFTPKEGEAVIWNVTTTLTDSTQYYWEVLVTDGNGGKAQSPLASFNVNTSNQTPTSPVLIDPLQQASVSTTSVDLTISNSSDPESDPLEYLFEIDSHPDFNSVHKQQAKMTSGVGQTIWKLTGLKDNTRYYWRVRAYDGSSYSQWLKASFKINLGNDAPDIPGIVNPGDQSWVTTLKPILQIEAASDKDGDPLEYQFQLSTTSMFNNQQTLDMSNTHLNQPLAAALLDNTRYYWRVRAIDSHGLASPWSATQTFFVNNNGVNDAPEITLLEPSKTVKVNNSLMIRWSDQDPDSNASISLYYSTSNDLSNATLIVADLQENGQASQDSYLWDTSKLADGTYYILAKITDEASHMVSVATGQVIKHNTPPVVTIKTNSQTTITQGDLVLLSVKVKDSSYQYDYRYLQQQQGNNNWQLLQDWTSKSSYQWDSSALSGNVKIQVQVRRSNTSSPIGHDEITFKVNIPVNCATITAVTLDPNSFQLNVPFVNWGGSWYHTKFNYLGNSVWKLSDATEVNEGLPSVCQSKVQLNGSTLTLSDIHLSGSNTHYQASFTLQQTNAGFLLKLKNYNVKVQLSFQPGDVTQGEAVTFKTKVFDSMKTIDSWTLSIQLK